MRVNYLIRKFAKTHIKLNSEEIILEMIVLPRKVSFQYNNDKKYYSTQAFIN